MADFLTTREALSLPVKDVEFVAQMRQKYGSTMYDEGDVVPLQARDKAALCAVKMVKPRRVDPEANKKAKIKKLKAKKLDGKKNKSMSGKGKDK